MQQRPSQSVLLQAIARFLISDVYPSIPDKRLNFRVLIAAHLANMVSAEIESEHALIEAELARLTELMPDAPAAHRAAQSDAQRLQLLSELNAELAERIRQGRLSPQARRRALSHVKESLLRSLAVDNPRFDTSAEIE